ncbi:hypothetical protein CSB45_06045 [candidate division KSB3 bacterium]|uniref:Uncharacterized protein n=1 Tax=candidate division KSB3 bacterium TaxID=2044937 RepID=A0A2G6E6W1_9BACT|nr:MAG: hypothetical protein CSB45_06045 [candidate division KSB3 bacterium]PIE30209.1 MAG: hypothetical protein CSA57_04760 [candidate division KSB3 bacterium]
MNSCRMKMHTSCQAGRRRGLRSAKVIEHQEIKACSVLAEAEHSGHRRLEGCQQIRQACLHARGERFVFCVQEGSIGTGAKL